MIKKIIYSIVLAASMLSLNSCKKFLDINSDPDTPQQPDASSVFPAMLAAIPRGTQYDARYIAKYIQNWNTSTANDTWDLHNALTYADASDVAGDIWRQTYFGLGANLNYIIDNGTVKGQWDYVGAAQALKAMMFQMCTDVYGEIIFYEAFKENTSTFKYDDQQVVYRGVDSICRLAVYNLSRTDLNPGSSTLAKGDYTYDGNKAKWIKFVYGLMARNFVRYSNKSGFSPALADSIIKYTDPALGMASGADDFLVPFEASRNDDANFFGPYRNNMATFRQSNMIVKLLDGRTLAGAQTVANRDPRISHMLSASNDLTNGNGGYRGVDAGSADPGSNNTRVAVLWGDSLYANPSSSVFNPGRGKYLFRDKVVSPVMTFSEMQFLRAEAYMRSGRPTLAHGAYIAGIQAHFDFINRATYPKSNQQLYNTTPITAAQITAYMASPNVKTAATITLSDIMQQKYIAGWGWNFVETWVDMRRYHYTDLDPISGQKIYKDFYTPALPAVNAGRFAARLRPRYNSEYVWNKPELDRIGATAPDYHAKPMWFMLP